MTTDRLTMQDPRSQYPAPPFAPQEQAAPGLASKMNPQPDHGEDSYEGHKRLLNRKALITGGDSGIGRAAAIAYAREGADVAISFLPEEKDDAKEVIALIEKAGRKGFALPGDITDEAFCKKMVEDAAQLMGGLDILVNNAAAQTTEQSILDIKNEDFDRTMKTNIYALLWITKAAIPHLKPGSAIINTTSIQAFEPSRPILDYAMTKAAIADFTKGLAKELIEKGVRVNGIAPGPFWTPIQPTGSTPEKVKNLGANVPLKRPGQPVETAPLYVLLASQEASYITGEIFGITGGIGVV